MSLRHDWCTATCVLQTIRQRGNGPHYLVASRGLRLRQVTTSAIDITFRAQSPACEGSIVPLCITYQARARAFSSHRSSSASLAFSNHGEQQQLKQDLSSGQVGSTRAPDIAFAERVLEPFLT